MDLLPIDPMYVTFGLSEADNAVKMTAQNLGGTIKGKFHYQWLLIFCHGDFTVTIKDGGAQLYTSVPLTT